MLPMNARLSLLAVLVCVSADLGAPVPPPKRPGTFEPGSDADWPCWRGAALDGRSRSRNAPTQWSNNKNVVWKIALPGRGLSSPVLWGDRIFLTAADETNRTQSTIACSRKTGKILWETRAHQAANLL